MKPDFAPVEKLYDQLADPVRERIDRVVSTLVAARRSGQKIVVVTGSGPNLHEGVTTLIAELIRNDVVHGVITSSAVVAHEMAGALDRVKRVNGRAVGVDPDFLPKGDIFELTLMDSGALESIGQELPLDRHLIERMVAADGQQIIKAAGNMGYPMGLYMERLAVEVESLCRTFGLPFEEVAGLGADPRTMIGAAALRELPVLVSVPQLIGGGMVGLCIADSIPVRQRSARIAAMLSEAAVVIESGVALTQEIHDGPFETHTGHGIWSRWSGVATYSLKGKTLIRIDLDPNLERVWELERAAGSVQQSIDAGLPKTKTFRVPFRMEMSGFARLEGSIPVVGDLGVVWPIIASHTASALGISLEFMSYPQETEQGRAMRDWIVDAVKPMSRAQMLARLPGRTRRRADQPSEVTR